MIDYLKISIYTLVAVFILAFALPVYENANAALDNLRFSDKSMVKTNIKFLDYEKDNEHGNYAKIYKYVEGYDAFQGEPTETIEVNGVPIVAKKVYTENASIYDILTVLDTFCIQGKYMDCDRLYLKDRYITKSSSTVVSLKSALANLDISGSGKYVLVSNGRDSRFIDVTENDGKIFVKGE